MVNRLHHGIEIKNNLLEQIKLVGFILATEMRERDL